MKVICKCFPHLRHLPGLEFPHRCPTKDPFPEQMGIRTDDEPKPANLYFTSQHKLPPETLSELLITFILLYLETVVVVVPHLEWGLVCIQHKRQSHLVSRAGGRKYLFIPENPERLFRDVGVVISVGRGLPLFTSPLANLSSTWSAFKKFFC